MQPAQESDAGKTVQDLFDLPGGRGTGEPETMDFPAPEKGKAGKGASAPGREPEGGKSPQEDLASHMMLQEFIFRNQVRELTGLSPGDPGVLDALLHVVRTGTAEERADAAKALGEMELDQAAMQRTFTVLVGLLHAPEAMVRQKALVTLVGLRLDSPELDAQVLAALEDALGSGGAVGRGLAAEAAGRLGVRAPGVLQALRDNLASDDQEVRGRAALALAQILGKDASDALPQLREYLAVANTEQAFKVLRILPVFGDLAGDFALQALARLEQDHPVTRWAAARALGSMGVETMREHHEVMRGLIQMTRFHEPSVRISSILSLGRLGPAAPYAAATQVALQQALSDPDPNVREAAAWALVQHDPCNARLLPPELEVRLPEISSSISDYWDQAGN